MNKAKILSGGGAVLATAGSALAEGEANYFDLTALSTIATEMGTDVKALFTGDILTTVATILGGVIVVWGLTIIWRWVKHVAGR